MDVALVTGASRGIGRAVARALAGAGYLVAAAARDAEALGGLVAGIAEAGGRAETISVDVRSPDSCRAAVQRAETLGPVSVLVNNAGVGIFKEAADLSDDDWEATLRTNLDGAFYMTRALLPALFGRARGHVINVASIAGWRGFAGGAAYAASKFGLMGFSESLMLECRPKGVRVTVVSPGSVDTDFHARQDRAWMLRPEDVADAVLMAVQARDGALVDHVMLRPMQPPEGP